MKDPNEEIVTRLLHIIGENPMREGLLETPKRFLSAWKDMTQGYEQKPEDVLKAFEDGGEGYDELVFQSNIPLYSSCEHHLLPFFGVAHIAYMPDKRIVGLSKLTRLVDIFAKRLQVQERLGCQIADALHKHLGCKGVGVVIQARHMCMESRGVQKVGTVTMTSALRGSIKHSPELRSEFMSLVNVAKNG